MSSAAGLTVSVVIATYNRPAYLRECLTHVLEQDVSPTAIVVVDSSEGQDTARVVEDFPSVTYLRNPRGRGSTGTAKRIGLEHTSSDVVAFLDDDAYAEPGWLGRLLSRYDDPAVAAVGGRALNGIPGEEHEGLDRIGLIEDDGTLTGYFAADPGHDVDVDHLLGANMSVRRAVVDELGGLQDLYPGTCLREESDMLLRMRTAGHRVVYTPDAVVRHVAGTYAKGRRFDLRYDWYGARNHVVLLDRTLARGDRRKSAYLSGVGPRAARLGGEAIAALRDGGERPARRLRNAAGRAARAGALLGGTAAGLGAAARLRLRDRTAADRRVASLSR
jgi:GT2 family glycosyltransferase